MLFSFLPTIFSINSFFMSLATSTFVTTLLIALSVASALCVFLGATIPLLKPYGLVAKLVFVICMGLIGFTIGYRVSDNRNELQLVKSELAFKAHQLEVQKTVSEFAQGEIKKLNEKSQQLEIRVTEYEEYVAKHPAPAACLATRDDVKRLRRIK